MLCLREQFARRDIASRLYVLPLVLLSVGSARCGGNTGPATPPSSTLRVGVGGLALQSTQAGVRQLVNNLSVEALINFNEDGRPRPWLAKSWSTAPGGLATTLQLRENARFHDGSLVDASIVSDVLKSALPKSMGPAFAEVEGITALDATRVEIRLRRPSSFLLDSLESPIQKPGRTPQGTGPFIASGSGPSAEMRSNGNYYLGAPKIDRITIETYPNVRAAWADMLRGHLDMLHEVGVDALDSMRGSNNVSVFTFTRHYQFLVILNTRLPSLQSAEIRRALNQAVDRDAIVKEAFSGHALASRGPVWPRHWAFDKNSPNLVYEPKAALETLRVGATRRNGKNPATRLTIRCLVPPDLTYERVALAVKRQLDSVGVDLVMQEAPMDEIGSAWESKNFEAVLIDLVGGPTLYRPYQVWHSGGAQNISGFSSSVVDEALDRIRGASTDGAFRTAVATFQKAMIDDPPAIFLAWGER